MYLPRWEMLMSRYGDFPGGGFAMRYLPFGAAAFMIVGAARVVTTTRPQNRTAIPPFEPVSMGFSNEASRESRLHNRSACVRPRADLGRGY